MLAFVSTRATADSDRSASERLVRLLHSAVFQARAITASYHDLEDVACEGETGDVSTRATAASARDSPRPGSFYSRGPQPVIATPRSRGKSTAMSSFQPAPRHRQLVAIAGRGRGRATSRRAVSTHATADSDRDFPQRHCSCRWHRVSTLATAASDRDACAGLGYWLYRLVSTCTTAASDRDGPSRKRRVVTRRRFNPRNRSQ
jgi:hypothetical protein